MKTSLRFPGVCVSLCFALLGVSCAKIKENEEAAQQARDKGKYAVRLTEDTSIQGTCKFIRNINSDEDPVERPTNASLPDYFRIKAAILGADTVLVSGRVGEAYICGPGPINPDGTRKTQYPTPTSP